MKSRILFLLLIAFYVQISFGQVANPVGNLEVCDDASDGDATNGFFQGFDFSFQTPGILGGQNPSDYSVTYHMSLSDANNGINPLISPYSNIIPNQQTIYARVTDNNTNAFATTLFDIVVNPIPVVSTAELKQCDDDTDGFSTFDLTAASSLLSANFMNETFRFYETEADAQNGSNEIINPTNYFNQTPSNDSVWVRVTAITGCFKTTQVTLIVSTTSIPNTFERNFSVCDDFLDMNGNDNANNDDTDGITSFDFSSVTSDVLALFPVSQQLSIVYYENESDGLMEINPINDISNYRNITSPNIQTIYIRVDSQVDNNCLGFGPFITLTVDPVATFNPVSNLVLCDDNSDGSNQNGFSQSFDLNAQTTAILGGQDPNVFTVSYHLSQADALSGANSLSSPFSNTTPFGQDIYVRIKNAATGCVNATGTFQVEVIVTVPQNDPLDMEVCDTNLDGFASFDLSSQDTQITGGDANLMVTYHSTQMDAGTGINALTSPYTNITANAQTIYVRLENISVGCINTTAQFDIIARMCADDDNDTVDDIDEDINGNGNLNDDDTDLDLVPNFMDDDDDDDGVLTVDEDYNNNGDPTDDDINNNNIPDYLDNTATLSTSSIESLRFSLFPNPTSDFVHIQFLEQLTEAKIAIYDTNGKVVVDNRPSIENNTAQVDISKLAKGMYFIKISSERKVAVKRLVVGGK